MISEVKYVPVLRHREHERSALGKVKLSTKCLPLVEIIKSPPKRGPTRDFGTYYTGDLKALGHPVMVDFPMYVSTVSSTKVEVFSFLRPLQLDPRQRFEHFVQLRDVPDLIPVVSYDPRLTPMAGAITRDASGLRAVFKRLAFRVFPGGLGAVLSEVVRVAETGDILLFDIHSRPYKYSTLLEMYRLVTDTARNHGMLSVVVRSAINDEVKHRSLIDDQPVGAADNGLLKEYKTYGFDAFGDFAGIKKDNLYDARGVSPGFLFYTWTTNQFIGYRSRYGEEVSPSERLKEFQNHIAPAVTESRYFAEQTESHRADCPGCRTVMNILVGAEKGNSPGKWKGISVAHYLCTMEERL